MFSKDIFLITAHCERGFVLHSTEHGITAIRPSLHLHLIRCAGRQGGCILSGGTQYLWNLNMKRALSRPAGIYNIEVAPRFLEHVCSVQQHHCENLKSSSLCLLQCEHNLQNTIYSTVIYYMFRQFWPSSCSSQLM
jgi:hypothetical protein